MINKLLNEIKISKKGIIVLDCKVIQFSHDGLIISDNLDALDYDNFINEIAEIQDIDLSFNMLEDGKMIIIIGRRRKTINECKQLAMMLKKEYDGSYDDLVSNIIGMPFHHDKKSTKWLKSFKEITTRLQNISVKLADTVPNKISKKTEDSYDVISTPLENAETSELIKFIKSNKDAVGKTFFHLKSNIRLSVLEIAKQDEDLAYLLSEELFKERNEDESILTPKKFVELNVDVQLAILDVAYEQTIFASKIARYVIAQFEQLPREVQEAIIVVAEKQKIFGEQIVSKLTTIESELIPEADEFLNNVKNNNPDKSFSANFKIHDKKRPWK